METSAMHFNEHSLYFAYTWTLLKPESVYDERVDNYNEVNDNCEKNN